MKVGKMADLLAGRMVVCLADHLDGYSVELKVAMMGCSTAETMVNWMAATMV